MRGAFVASFGPEPAAGELERIAAAMRWHTGHESYHTSGQFHVAVLADSADGPAIDDDGSRMLVVHGAQPRPLAELQRDGRRFAAVEYDGTTLAAARDPMGLCPLFFRVAKGALWLSTEIAPLAALAPVRPDLPALAALAALVPDDDRTGLSEIFRVVPGFVLEAGEDLQPRQRRYWQVAKLFGSYRGTRADAEEEMRRRLFEAVDRAVGPGTGIMLSGGIDSMAITAVASCLGREFCAVHVAFQGLADTAEDQHARRLASALGFRLDVIPGELAPWQPENDLEVSVVPYLTSPSYTAETALAHLAAADVSIAVDGKDGDGVLGYTGREWGELLRTGSMRRLAELSRIHGARKVLRGVYGDVVPPPLRLGRLRRRPLPPLTYLQWMERYFDEPLRTRMRRIDHSRWRSPFGEWRARQLRQVLPVTTNLNEERELRAARHGIDMRHPFADRSLVEFLISLPAAIKGDPFLSKDLIRRALATTAPPGTLERRDKSSFGSVYAQRVDTMQGLELIESSGVRLPLINYERVFSDAEDPQTAPTILLMSLARLHVFAASYA